LPDDDADGHAHGSTQREDDDKPVAQQRPRYPSSVMRFPRASTVEASTVEVSLANFDTSVPFGVPPRGAIV
jgi:hypothetical protein